MTECVDLYIVEIYFIIESRVRTTSSLNQKKKKVCHSKKTFKQKKKESLSQQYHADSSHFCGSSFYILFIFRFHIRHLYEPFSMICSRRKNLEKNKKIEKNWKNIESHTQIQPVLGKKTKKNTHPKKKKYLELILQALRYYCTTVQVGTCCSTVH